MVAGDRKEGNVLDKIFSDGISDELLELKKKLAEEVVHKIQSKDSGLMSTLLEGSMVDYLVNEKTITDIFHDEIFLSSFGESIGLITEDLKRYREMFNGVKTEEDLEELKIKIFDDIEKGPQSGSSTRASAGSSTVVGAGSTKSSGVDTQKSTVGCSGLNGLSNQKSKVDTRKGYEIDHFDVEVSSEIRKRWENLKGKEKPELEPFACAMKAYEVEKSLGHLKNMKYLTVVDFTKNQLTQNRFFVVNLDVDTVEYSEMCGHGEGSGDKEWATSFSNKSGSHQSSLGAYITNDHSKLNGKRTWHGNFPKGQEKSNKASRGIAIHPVGSLVYKTGKSTSDGCFTIPRSQEYVDEILSKIEGGSLVFSYAKSEDYFAQSNYFHKNSDGSYAA